MSQTSSQGFRYPAGGDAPSGPLALQHLAEDAEAHGVSYFTSAADRTSKLPSPVAGQLAYLRDVKRYEFWDGSRWSLNVPLPVQSLQVSSPSSATYGATLNTFVDFTSAQWPAAACVVPPSGIVEAGIRAHLTNTVTGTALIRAALRFTGAITRAADADESLLASGTTLSAATFILLSGLTPGLTLTAIPQWDVSQAGTSTQTAIAGGAILLRPVA